MPCLVEGIGKQSREAIERGAIIPGGNSTFSHTNHSARSAYPLIRPQQIGPIPGTQPTGPKAMIDQIEGGIRKIEGAQGILDVKLNSITHPLCYGLFICIPDHLLANIYAH